MKCRFYLVPKIFKSRIHLTSFIGEINVSSDRILPSTVNPDGCSHKLNE